MKTATDLLKELLDNSTVYTSAIEADHLYDLEAWEKDVRECIKNREDALKNSVTDGFGSYASKTCPECGEDTIVVVRPGKFQCTNCE